MVLGLAGCDGPEAEEAVVEAIVEETDPELVRRSTVAVPETFERLDLLVDLQERVLELEVEIAEYNEGYAEINFDNFLELDPWGLATDQVYFLKHFCDNGDFTLRKEAEVVLLERELIRRRSAAVDAAPAGGERVPLQERLDIAIGRYEQRVADLEKIASMYRDKAGGVIEYPTDVEPDVLDGERRYVQGRQEAIRDDLEQLDGVIVDLREALEVISEE